MDVTCPECDMLYQIDARQMRGGAATFKCSRCSHMFRLQTEASLNRENQRRWMVKNSTTGDVLYFDAFDQLHQWILQGDVGKTDQISRTGDRWRTLESIGEFKPIFQAVDSISTISAAADSADEQPDAAPDSSAGTPAGHGDESSHPESGHSPAHTPAPSPSRTPNDPEYSQSRSRPTNAAAGQRAAEDDGRQHDASPEVRLQTGAFGAGSTSRADASDQTDDEAWSFGEQPTLGETERSGNYQRVDSDDRSHHRRWVVAAVALVVVIGAVAVAYTVRPDWFGSLRKMNAAADDVAASADPAESTARPGSTQSTSSRRRVQDAVGAALAAARTANATLRSIEAARPDVFSGVAAARKAANEAARTSPKENTLAVANRDLERGRSRRAAQKFRDVLDDAPRNAAAITGLGWSLLASGQPAAAAAQFHKALRYDPGHGDAYIGLGKAQRNQGHPQAALDAYQDYLSRFPGGRKSSIANYQADKLRATIGR